MSTVFQDCIKRGATRPDPTHSDPPGPAIGETAPIVENKW